MVPLPEDRDRDFIRVLPLRPQFVAYSSLPDTEGYANVHHAAAQGNMSVLSRLGKQGGALLLNKPQGIITGATKEWPVDDRIYRVLTGVTPLQLAAFFGHIDAVEFLIKHGANVNAKARARDCSQRRGFVSALYLALQEGHTEIAVILFQYGAELFVPNQCQDLHVLLKETVLGVSSLWPGNDEGVWWSMFRKREIYSPLSVVDPLALSRIISTWEFSQWIGQSEATRKSFCRAVYGCALSRVLSHHVQLAQTYRTCRSDRALPTVRMLELLFVLKDHKLLFGDVLLELFDRRLEISNSYLAIGGSIAYGDWPFTAIDCLMILGGLAMFGVFPREEEEDKLMRAALDGFEGAQTSLVRMDILKLFECLLRTNTNMKKHLKDNHQTRVKNLKEKVENQIKKMSESLVKVQAGKEKGDVTRIKDNILVSQARLCDLQKLYKMFVDSSDLPSLHTVAVQKVLKHLRLPSAVECLRFNKVQLLPIVFLLWSETNPILLYTPDHVRDSTLHELELTREMTVALRLDKIFFAPEDMDDDSFDMELAGMNGDMSSLDLESEYGDNDYNLEEIHISPEVEGAPEDEEAPEDEDAGQRQEDGEAEGAQVAVYDEDVSEQFIAEHGYDDADDEYSDEEESATW